MIERAYVWKCDYCLTEEMQTGPRAMAMPQIPPEKWILIDVVWLVPAHSVMTTAGPQKVGDARESMRKVACPACSQKVRGVVLV
jgi:hypothetical protein